MLQFLKRSLSICSILVLCTPAFAYIDQEVTCFNTETSWYPPISIDPINTAKCCDYDSPDYASGAQLVLAIILTD